PVLGSSNRISDDAALDAEEDERDRPDRKTSRRMGKLERRRRARSLIGEFQAVTHVRGEAVLLDRRGRAVRVIHGSKGIIVLCSNMSGEERAGIEARTRCAVVSHPPGTDWLD